MFAKYKLPNINITKGNTIEQNSKRGRDLNSGSTAKMAPSFEAFIFGLLISR